MLEIVSLEMKAVKKRLVLVSLGIFVVSMFLLIVLDVSAKNTILNIAVTFHKGENTINIVSQIIFFTFNTDKKTSKKES